MDISNEPGIRKAKRLTSVVWNHFERVRKADTCYAVCVHCNKKLSGSSNSGTTHLRNHLMRCLKRSNYDVSQLLAAKRRKKETVVGYDEGQRKDEYMKSAIIKYDPEPRKDDVIALASGWFDQERSRLDLARMIIMHGYPLSMSEHIGFKMFVKNLQPLFEIVPSSTIELSCLEHYGKEKQKVYDMLGRLQGRVNVAVEGWLSPEGGEFLCLMAHYIDEEWKLQKKVLNFLTLGSSHGRDILFDLIMKCLIDWDIECKLFAMTFDECYTNDDVVLRIKDRISQTRPLFSNGQLFDVRSAAHVLNLIVQDAIGALRDVCEKVRDSIRYVKSTQATLEKFNEATQLVGSNCQKNLVLDSPSKLFSTYIMLETAVEYKDAFCQLQQLDSEYISFLTSTEWEWATGVTSYLKLFAEITNAISGNKCSTSNMYFPEICDIHIQLIEWCKNPDCFLSSVAMKMKARFDEYWSKCSLALAVAAILDPRFKMKLVEYYYSQIYGSTALDRIKEVSDGLKGLFNAYFISSTVVDVASSFSVSSMPCTSDSRDRLKGFDKFLHETSQSHCISDLDKYLEEPVFPRNCDFNILNWWKVHTPRYPILSMMARDVLGTPMSTVSQESAVMGGDRMLDSYRTSLNSELRQALICTRDWFKQECEDHGTCSGALYLDSN